MYSTWAINLSQRTPYAPDAIQWALTMLEEPALVVGAMRTAAKVPVPFVTLVAEIARQRDRAEMSKTLIGRLQMRGLL